MVKNDINKKQNNEDILLFLFAQRKLYSVSKRIFHIIFFVNLLFYILGLFSTVQSNNYFIAIYILWIIAICMLQIKVSEKINIAATMQELIDRKLYDFNIYTPFLNELKLHKRALKLKEKYSKEFIKQISRDGKQGGVKDWYSDVSGVPIERAILLCQIENNEWENQLRRKYQYFNIFLLIIFVLIYIVVFWNNSVENLIVNMYPILPVLIDRLSYIYRNHNNIEKGENINRSLDYIYENIKELTKEDVLNKAKEIQHCIYDRRKYFSPIPNLFYDFNRSKYQSYSNKYISDLKKKLKS